MRSSGGNGGHNGLKSIQEALGNQDFKRMRIGIGSASPKYYTEHVLNDFSEEEASHLPEICSFANQILDEFVNDDFQKSLEFYSKNKKAYSKVIDDLRIARPKE